MTNIDIIETRFWQYCQICGNSAGPIRLCLEKNYSQKQDIKRNKMFRAVVCSSEVCLNIAILQHA